MNETHGALVPAPALCAHLGLVNRPRELDLFDRAGRRASIYTSGKSGEQGIRGEFLFIREDLLRRYLHRVGKEVVWFVWGERDLKVGIPMSRREECADIYQEYANIHRRAYSWSEERPALKEHIG